MSDTSSIPIIENNLSNQTKKDPLILMTIHQPAANENMQFATELGGCTVLMYNSILIGRLTKDPDSRVTASAFL